MSWELAIAALVGGAAGWSLRHALSRSGRAPAGAQSSLSGEPLAKAFEHLNEGVLILDDRDRILAMNPAARRLVAGEDSADDEQRDGVQAGLDQTLGNRLAAAVSSAGAATVRTFVEQGKADAPRTLALTVGPAGRNKRFVLLEDFSGITSADRRRRDFVANASHELQTPIAAVMGMLELMEGAGGEYQRDLLRRSQKRIADLSVLTKDLMGLARADDSSWSPPTRPVQMVRLCEAVVERHEQEAADKGLTLELLVEQEVEVIGGATSIETCVSNLVQNAISYTDEGGVILRVESCPDDGVAVTVEDTGCGIPPHLVPRIFERFFRVDPARSREAGGSGLGLAIVRNLAGSMGGRIAVSSQPGEGSRFRLELPSDPTRPLEGSGVVLHG